MDADQIHQMARLEDEHWWYRGLRNTIQRTLQMPEFNLPSQLNVLDAGCGTGANLKLLKELLAPAYAGGFDLSPDAVQLCREKVGDEADVYQSDLRNPEIRVNELDLLLSCDAISVAGLDESKNGLLQLIERLRVGGLFILNMPAFSWLFSSHDVITRTRDRMNAPEIRSLFADLGLRVELLTYRVFSLFPAIVMARMPSMLERPGEQVARSDLKPVPSAINKTLEKILAVENWMVTKGVGFPWGSSVYAVGRKIQL